MCILILNTELITNLNIMKHYHSLTLLLIFQLFSCNNLDNTDPGPTDSSIILDEFALSNEFDELQSRYGSLNLREADIVDFNQSKILSVPIARAVSNIRNTQFTKEDRLLIRFGTKTKLEFLFRIKIDGESIKSNYKEFTGSIIFEVPAENYSLEIKYDEGKFESYQIKMPDLDSRAKSTNSRNDSAGCESTCELLDCVGEKFEEAGTLEKFECVSNITICIILYTYQCISEEGIGPY